MRRRLFAVLVGCISAFAIAGVAFADTVPDPGNFRDSGSAVYLDSFAFVCGQSTCTDTYVYGSVTTLRGGETFSYACVDQYTYPLRGGGAGSSLSGCADGVGPDIANDLSSGSLDVTVLAQECGRHNCSQEVELSVSVDLSAVSDPNSYSYTQKQQYENCTDTYRIRGEASDAEGTIVVDGTALEAFGRLGAETFAFSTRCR